MTGDQVTITGSAFAAANGTFTITVISPTSFSLNGTSAAGADSPSSATWVSTNEFSLNGSTGTGAYTGHALWSLLGNITGANEVGGVTPVVIKSPGNNLATGDVVTVAGTGFADGTFTITVLNGAIASASAAVVGGPITITTTLGEQLTSNDSVVISGNSYSGANGTFTITVTGSNTFTLNGTSAGAVGVLGTGGTYLSQNEFSLNGTSTAGSSATGTWTTQPGLTASTYTVDGLPQGMALADINQDGNLDVMIGNSATDNVLVYTGTGKGTFNVAADTSLGTNSPGQVVVADFNDDGIPDIAMVTNDSTFFNASITFFQGLGAGQYGAPVTISPAFGVDIVGLAVGHFSANGTAAFPDVAFADNFFNQVSFLQNTMTVPGAPITVNSFTDSINSVFIGNNPSAIAVGDFNKDGLDDLVVTFDGGGHHGGNSGVDVLVNTSTPLNDFNFSSTTYDNTTNTPIDSLAVGDFNNDGNLDFVVGMDGNPGQIILNTGDGLGNFSAGTIFNTGVINPVSIAVADYNNDSYQDVVVASSDTTALNGGVAILLNQFGTGFGTAIQTDVIPGTGLNSVVADDVNGDGVADVVVGTTLPVLDGNIQFVSNSGGLVQINTSVNNGLVTGEQVVITGVTGVGGLPAAADGTWTITVINPNSFTLNGSTFAGFYTGGGSWAAFNTTFDTSDNVFVMIGNGDGTLKTPVPYLAGELDTPYAAPTFLAVTPTPLLRVTTFTSGGTLIEPNLINNGNFETIDLSGEKGNLVGWQIYDETNVPGSRRRLGTGKRHHQPLERHPCPRSVR